MRDLSDVEKLELKAAIGVEKLLGAMIDLSTGDFVNDFELYHRLMKHYGIEPDMG